ncbi:MAG: hypothetical protein CR965_00530 [Paludibacter sp.]|nr:MAG: hypothetical protein CR965_00530 [Paludibacter sp.]
MKKRLFLLLLSIYPIFTFALPNADKGYYFYVQLKDKNNSPYSLDNPSLYLSQRAIDRRNYFSIPIDSLDLPVNPSYVSSIKNLGIYVHCKSKWLNGVTVLVKDSSVISSVRALSFVEKAEFTGITTENQASYVAPRQKVVSVDYGESGSQIKQMNGQYLHDAGFLGEDIQIAVIDAGFNDVDVNPGFAYLRNSGRLLGTKDFVNPFSNIYNEHSHGASVLTTMAGKADNNDYLGSAPEASYWLLRSEAGDNEYLCETDFWMSAIEYADSVGADVATTSLGYYEFDDATMNFTHADLDGKTVRASISANIATQKGMMLLNAAGNEGTKSWKKIGIPSDAEGVITVGAVKADSTMASFSSYGYSADGRVKPELCARGQGTILLNNAGMVSSGNGTSFATPLLAGLTACYLQAAKSKGIQFTLEDLRDNMYRSAHLYPNPTTHTGYGIPNFQTALVMLDNMSTRLAKSNQTIKISLTQKSGILSVITNLNLSTNKTISIYDVTGHKVLTKKSKRRTTKFDISSLASGVYVIYISTSNNQTKTKLFVK